MLDWGEVLRQFSLGNAAILTNVCMLPLYPGLIAFLAGNMQQTDENGKPRYSPVATRFLGVFVLAGILTMMIFIGGVLYLLEQSFGGVLTLLLPVIYLVVIVFGVLMLTGRNPFARLAMVQAPVLRNPFATSYVYGLLLGPMTLPCTGPIITTAFILGAGTTAGLLTEMVYVIAFGIGFGWPLLLLPLFATEVQRRFTGWLSRNHLLLTRVSGVLLVGIGVFGIVVEVLPNTNIV